MAEPRLNLLVLRSPNVSRLVAFYEAIGLRFVKEQHGNGPEHFAATCGGVVIEIYPSDAPTHAESQRLGFNVDAIEPLLDAITSRDGKVVTPPKQTAWGMRAVIADPEGRRIELIEK